MKDKKTTTENLSNEQLEWMAAMCEWLYYVETVNPTPKPPPPTKP